MEAKIFDTHAHYTSKAFDEDRESFLRCLPEKNVALVLSCGTDFESSENALALAEKYDWIFAAAGIHPQSLIEEERSTFTHFNGDWREEFKHMQALYDNDKIVAVGEVGLDYYWPVPKDEQLMLFEAQIRFALERDLPLSIHDRSAHEDVYRLLKKYKPRGVLHSYSGSAEDTKWMCNQGLYIAFSGVLTFKNAKKTVEAAAAVPLEYLLLETDCPHLSPEPFRGKRNHSAMLSFVAKKMAEIRKTSEDEILKKTLENGRHLFNINF